MTLSNLDICISILNRQLSSDFPKANRSDQQKIHVHPMAIPAPEICQHADGQHTGSAAANRDANLQAGAMGHLDS